MPGFSGEFLSISGKNVSVVTADRRVPGSIKIDETTCPGRLTLHLHDSRFPKVLIQHGVYEVRGDCLRIAFVGRDEHPTEVSADAGSLSIYVRTRE